MIHRELILYMYLKLLIFFIFSALIIPSSFAKPEEYYEKSEIKERMEKREIISVVKIVDPERENLRVLDMTTAGVIEGVSLDKAIELMSDYENLQKIAPEYIKLSELIVKRQPEKEKKKKKYLKYVHMKTEVSTLLGSYKVEVYSKVQEEKLPEKGIVYWEIVPGSELGRSDAPGDFVGLKGFVTVSKYQRLSSSTPVTSDVSTGRGVYRGRPQKDYIFMLFKGKMEKDQKGISKVVPNFILQFAMEVALQRVGILLRNYLETMKDAPYSPKSLEELAKEEDAKMKLLTQPKSSPDSAPIPASQ